jgi:hypothetical protein
MSENCRELPYGAEKPIGSNLVVLHGKTGLAGNHEDSPTGKAGVAGSNPAGGTAGGTNSTAGQRLFLRLGQWAGPYPVPIAWRSLCAVPTGRYSLARGHRSPRVATRGCRTRSARGQDRHRKRRQRQCCKNPHARRPIQRRAVGVEWRPVYGLVARGARPGGVPAAVPETGLTPDQRLAGTKPVAVCYLAPRPADLL